jgi:glutathione S-transferase
MSISVHQSYVLLSGLFVWAVHFFLGMILVGRARRKYGIPLPNLYESHDADFKLKTPFNNYQRGHMNMVENTATFYFLLLASAMFNPLHAAIAGFVWGFGRLIYGVGYGFAPSYRVVGEFFVLAEFYMIYIIGSGCYYVITQ